MRAVLIASLAFAVSLSATSLVAADVTSPLAPGRPAGVKQAQDMHDNLSRLALGVAAIGIILICVLPTSATSSTATSG
jgi:hypothetical protein